MRSIVYGLILLTLLASGCSSAAAPATRTPLAPTQTPRPVATDTPAPTVPPATLTPTHVPNAIPTDQLDASLFRFYEANPVLQQSNNPRWDNLYVDPGAVLYHEGQFHMFYNGINGFPAPVRVGYATSQDGSQWQREVDEPVLSAQDLEGPQWIGNNFFVTSGLVEPDGTWILYFYTLGMGGFNGPGEIGRATAPAPTGPWSIDPDPLLSPGPQGSWDDVQVSAPNVLKTDDSYLMFFDALGSGNTSMIGMATSTDGTQWTKYNDPSTSDPAFTESDPVLRMSDNGWDSKRVIDPNVLQTADGFEMIYLATTGSGKFASGEFAFGIATSTDGVTWSKSDQNPVLTNKDHPQWSQAFLASLVRVDETYFLYFDLVTPSRSGTNVYLTTYEGSLTNRP